MREIKFRAWWDNGKDSDMLFVGDNYGTKHPLDCCRYLAEGQPVTLMQYTGLRDKNGVEIYEGDIVSLYQYRDGYEVAAVEYDPIKGFKPFHEPYDYDLNYPYYEEKNIEVIGNIHQNPELLSK